MQPNVYIFWLRSSRNCFLLDDAGCTSGHGIGHNVPGSGRCTCMELEMVVVSTLAATLLLCKP